MLSASEVEELRQEIERWKSEYKEACSLNLDMFEAATGVKGQGPKVGIVEDIAQLRHDFNRAEKGRVEALQDAERLRKNLLDLQRRRGEGERGEFWIWQDDEHDNVESLTCDVLVTAERMRKFVAAEKLLDENY